MIRIVPATTTEQFRLVEQLAWDILPDFYADTIADEHTRFFIEKLLSVQAIEEQVAKDFDYYLLQLAELTVGFMGLRKAPPTLFLSKIYILNSQRGKKVGGTSIQFVEAFARNNGYERIELEVNKHNKKTITIYEHYGYRLLNLKVNTFENGYAIEDYRMEKVL